MRILLAPLAVLLASCAAASPSTDPSAQPAASTASAASSAPAASTPPPTVTADATASAVATAAPAQAFTVNPGGLSAPTPYTTAQIRTASPAGRRIVFRIELPGKPASLHILEFLSADDNGAEIRSSDTDLKGHVLSTTTERSTWEELRLHAVFPNAQVTITTGKNPGPMGPLPCIVYTVTDGTGPDSVTRTLYFAKDLPGPPVHMVVEKGGAKIRTMTMEVSTTSE